MDKIQKVLIKAGRKDLAQQYYKKIATEWSSKEALENYLRKHPNADKSLHHVQYLNKDEKEIKKRLLESIPKNKIVKNKEVMDALKKHNISEDDYWKHRNELIDIGRLNKHHNIPGGGVSRSR